MTRRPSPGRGRGAGPAGPVPFHGTTRRASCLSATHTTVVSFDLTTAGPGELTSLLQALTDRARSLTAGGIPPPVGVRPPPSDSGVLGPVGAPDGLTVTVGRGLAVDDRFGLAARQPSGLTPMGAFPDDALDPAQCGGDLSLVLAAGSTDTVVHALRDIAPNTRGAMQARWRIDGFSSPPRPRDTPQPDGVQGRHRQPVSDDPTQMRGSCGWRRRAATSVMDGGRQLSGGPADQDVRGVLGPGLGRRAGAHVRPARPTGPRWTATTSSPSRTTRRIPTATSSR